MTTAPLSFVPGHRLGRGSVLEDLAMIEAGVDQGLLVRAEVLLEWVEENEIPPEPDRFGPGPSIIPVPVGELRAGPDDLGARLTSRDEDGVLPSRPVPIAGEGAPMVSDLALVDLAATLRRSVVSATRLVGGITELGYRLPMIWDRCRQGGVPLWRALRVAEKTMTVPTVVATQVDAEVVSVLGSCSWAQVDRCIQAALTRHEESLREAGADDDTDDDTDTGQSDGHDEAGAATEDARDVRVHLSDAGTDPHMLGADGIGLTGIDGLIDDADALDLEQAIRDLAAALAAAGSNESLGVRRAKALGMLARGEAPLSSGQHAPHGAGASGATENSSTSNAGPTGAAPAPGSRRQVLLMLHLTQAGLDGEDPVGRCENTLAPASVEQIKDWCTGAKVKIQPVLDLSGHHPVGSYEIPDRLRDQVRNRDLECVFPHCHRPTRACDLDHITPYPQGPTCACNLAPLCRRHHRAKTARRWTYLMVHPGTYYWRAPSGATYLVDAHGTHQLPDLGVPGAADRHRRRCPSETPGSSPSAATTPGSPPPTLHSSRARSRGARRQSRPNRSSPGPSSRPPPDLGWDDSPPF
ncbi:HNH endonuclease signature motif containing protein [Ruania albidiflava]|uniref:HNH endonuclease signature motif containing protein n=1 Tax=Ruania albidiflava TaxID=366586 RepID=UPI0003B722CD|nr:HNH endonuclease signature motif containing protein [Ruania albidiflava]